MKKRRRRRNEDHDKSKAAGRNVVGFEIKELNDRIECSDIGPANY